MLLQNFSITEIAGMFHCVQLREVLCYSVFRISIKTVTPPSHHTGIVPRMIHFSLREIIVDNMALGWFSSEFFHISRSFFLPLNNIHSPIIQDGSHLPINEVPNEWSYNVTPTIRLPGKYMDKMTLPWSSIYEAYSESKYRFAVKKSSKVSYKIYYYQIIHFSKYFPHIRRHYWGT